MKVPVPTISITHCLDKLIFLVISATGSATAKPSKAHLVHFLFLDATYSTKIMLKVANPASGPPPTTVRSESYPAAHRQLASHPLEKALCGIICKIRQHHYIGQQQRLHSHSRAILLHHSVFLMPHRETVHWQGCRIVTRSGSRWGGGSLAPILKCDEMRF